MSLQIKAPPALCFDLARSIDLHQVSAQQTGEKAIGGVTTGLIELDQSVTWRAKHFGIWQKLTAQITEFDYPHRFVDEMVEGAFQHFHHEHRFEATDYGTLMTDTFEYSVPYGFLGKLFDWLILRSYMRRFLTRRNEVIKKFAESRGWRKILQSSYDKLPEAYLSFYSFQVMMRLFEQLWFASDNAQSPIAHMWFHVQEVARSLEIRKSIILPYVRLLVDKSVIQEVPTEPLLYEFTSQGILIKSDDDIRNFLSDISLST